MYLYNYWRIMSLYTYPLNMNSSQSNGNGDHRITFQQLKTRAQNPEPVLGDMVALYLPPDALKTSYTQSYGDIELGGVGQAIMTADQGAMSAALDQGLAGNFGSAVTALQRAGVPMNIKDALATGVAKEISDKAQGAFGTAVQALGRKVGKIKNHHKAIVYQGPGGFRTFSFSFVMMPKSKKEADEVNKIVHFFKYYMHPEVTGQNNRTRGTMGTNTSINPRSGQSQVETSLTLSYPDEFKIRITPRGSDGDTDVGTKGKGNATNVKPLFKIDRCFLESLSVDYTTSGQPVFFNDGNEPVTTTLQLSFKETRLMTKESIARGF